MTSVFATHIPKRVKMHLGSFKQIGFDISSTHAKTVVVVAVVVVVRVVVTVVVVVAVVVVVVVEIVVVIVVEVIVVVGAVVVVHGSDPLYPGLQQPSQV